MDLSVFNTIEQKRNAYEYRQAFSFEDVQKTLQQVSTEGDGKTFFRGVAEGAWKIYSFAQREWITKELNYRFGSFEDFMSLFLEYSKTTESIRLNHFCKVVADPSVFSVLQHYGAPTPFIDWTSDYNVALYFATHSSNGICSGYETNSFVSVYWITPGKGAYTPNNDLTRFSDVIKEHKQNMNAVIEENGNISGSNYADATSYNIWKNEVFWMEETKDEIFMQISNPRSDLQRGSFVYTPESAKPLNEVFLGTKSTDDDCTTSGTCYLPPKAPNDEYFIPTAPLCETGDSVAISYYPKINCLDIHKSVVPQIQKYLRGRNVNTSLLGLDSDNWGMNTYKSFLEDYNRPVDPVTAILSEI
ncbi:FRG domain-containing protein [Fibrobacter sp. UWB12]|uniref:FRG domain-containing protein n=1 Tax=Fibrobacter sp. UWB12 TaxID=1896203 RepID=UPI001587C81A|nr:FRG domain-containing protein [Fibrobacter sp. UWB12]